MEIYERDRDLVIHRKNWKGGGGKIVPSTDGQYIA